MFAKRLLQKATQLHHHHQHDVKSCLTPEDINVRINVHYGVPSTASILAFDPIQCLLAVGTLDGRIKLIGGDNIEELFVSLKQLPYKYLEFLQNQGSLIGITIDNGIQVWSLRSRSMACSLQWEFNITAFSVITGSTFMYIGDEYGSISVLKYDTEDQKLLHLPYHLSSNSLAEAAGFSFTKYQAVVGVLPQPCSSENRVLIAYNNGLIVLWDVIESRVVNVRGDKVLELDNGVEIPTLDASDYYTEEKEITAVSWASSDGSILAVGYIDGDILFWKTSTTAPSKSVANKDKNGIVKLQLSSAEKRLPVIVLQWWGNHNSRNVSDGKLLIYGGDEAGAEEVVTVLNLEWSSGTETLKCVGRTDLTLRGSFADVILLPTAGTTSSKKTDTLLVLTNPGRLQIFYTASSSASSSEPKKKLSVAGVDFPTVVPTITPSLTVAKLLCLPKYVDVSKSLSEIGAMRQFASKWTLSGDTKSPLTGGVSNSSSFGKDNGIERLYIAGYQDGSVRIWDATGPVFSFLCVLANEVKGINISDLDASVSKLDFCFLTLRLAVGNDCGLVRIFHFSSSAQTSVHFVTESKHEVYNLAQVGPNCEAVFCFSNSRVQALEFTNHGAKLMAGYECGRVLVLDMKSLSALFLTDSISNPNSRLMSVNWKEIMHDLSTELKSPGTKDPDDHKEELMFILTNRAEIYVIDGHAGKIIRSMHLKKEAIAVSVYIIGKNSIVSGSLSKKKTQLPNLDATVGYEPSEDMGATEIHLSDNAGSGQRLRESLLLLCCTDSLRLYTLESVIKGDSKAFCKCKLAKPCCWTTTLVKDNTVCGLVLLYQTGELEIRCLPNLKLVKESSLMVLLKWKLHANMERIITSVNNGLVSLVNGHEVAVISLLANENDFRIPDSLPFLHDEVLAAATNAAMSLSSNQKKKKVSGPTIIGGLVKGLKVGKQDHKSDSTYESNLSRLEGIFMRNPFSNPSSSITDAEEDTELNIDDIEIDEVSHPASTSSSGLPINGKERKTEREKLCDYEHGDAKPRLRTREEIIATYRKTGDVSSVAGQARNKLLERQEKLERMSKQTAELQSGAEDFASLANELVRVMESRKWWQI